MSFQVGQMRFAWKVTCNHLLLALDREIFVGEIIFDNLLFMQGPDFRRWLNGHIIALMFCRVEECLRTGGICYRAFPEYTDAAGELVARRAVKEVDWRRC